MAQQIIKVIGGNLFNIAMLYLGDATQWNRIAEASGTGFDPVLPRATVTTLTIPNAVTDSSGGIYGAD